MTKLAAIAIAVFVVTAGVARADQCAWVTKDQAEAASAIVRGADHHRVAYFCKPCGDQDATKDVVKTTAVKRVKDDFFSLEINGKDVDLAYVYYAAAATGPYKNLAIGAKCKVVEVTDTIVVK